MLTFLTAHWKALLGVIAVFLLGAITGGLVTLKIAQAKMRQAMSQGPEGMGKLLVGRMAWRLRLDNDQRKQVQDILKTTRGKIQDTRRAIQPQTEAIIKESTDSIRAILREDQKDDFDRLIKESRPLWELPPKRP